MNKKRTIDDARQLLFLTHLTPHSCLFHAFSGENVILGFNHKVPTLHRSRKCVFHVSACFSLFYLLGCQVCLCSLLYSSSKPNMCTLLLCVGRFDDYNLLFSMITLEFVQTPCFNFFIPAQMVTTTGYELSIQ